jgi:phosphoglycerate dehydrogenase-like enzyme
MKNPLKVLYLPHPVEDINVEWGENLITTLCDRFDVRVFDRDQDLADQFQGREAVVDLGGNISGNLIDVAANAGVKFIQVQTNGLDHVEVDKILKSGMLLAHCPGNLSSVALAESAMMFVLMLSRRHGEGVQNFFKGKYYFPQGMELEGRSLGIVGFGASGQDLARRAKPFGMRILATDVRSIEQEVLDEIQPDFLGNSDDLDHVVAESDFLSVHLHLTDETRHILDARRIGLMKSTACIINVARGELVDEEALYQALLEERIAGAGLDVFADEPPQTNLPVYQLPNVCVSPHVAGGTDGTARKRAQFAADNVARFARGENVLARVE